jgi:hypothetical protein
MDHNSYVWYVIFAIPLPIEEDEHVHIFEDRIEVKFELLLDRGLVISN